MSTQVPVPTRDCVGIDVTRNGRVVASYDADSSGHVNVDNRSHARLLERTFGSRTQLAMGEGPKLFACECGRPKFAWQEVCAECHIKQVEVEDVTARS